MSSGGNPLSSSGLATAPLDVEAINHFYLRVLRQRELLTPQDVCRWIGQTVTLFLRHDSVDTFVVDHRHAAAGWANYVRLADVHFLVDEASRLQSLRQEGPLPNRRSIHACLRGRLIEARAQIAPWPQAQLRPVIYNPAVHHTFVWAETGQPVHFSRQVYCVNDRIKVWCR